MGNGVFLKAAKNMIKKNNDQLQKKSIVIIDQNYPIRRSHVIHFFSLVVFFSCIYKINTFQTSVDYKME